MTIGYHYLFKLDNWFHEGETNLESRYNLGSFELKGKVYQGIKQGFFALTNSSKHCNSKNPFIKEVIIGIPDFNLIQTSSLSDSEYSGLVKGFNKKQVN